MSKLEPKYEIDYSPRGDTIDSFAQKTKAEISLIYQILNALRENFPAAGDLRDSEPFQFHVDTASKNILIRNSTNDSWNVIGKVDEDYFGITAENIGAVKTDGTVNKISSGNENAKPTDAKTGDIFYDFASKRAYYYTGTDWNICFSLNFGDLTGYENYCVSRDEVAYNGKDKIPRLDKNTGKGNFDISGSPEKLLGYQIEISNLKDNDVLVFDNSKQKIINKPKDLFTTNDVSNNGGANKIVKTDNNGVANISISGSAAKIDGITVATSGITDKKVLGYNANYRRLEPIEKISADITGNAEKLSGVILDVDNLIDNQFLVYNATQKKIVSDKKEYLNEDDVSSTGAAGKIVRTDSAGMINANLNGSASKIGGIEINASGIKDGQVLTYDAAKRILKPANKDLITEDKISDSGEIGKLIRLGSDKTIHANVDGSVSKIDNVAFNLENISNGDLLSYDSRTQKIIPVAKDTNATSINQISVDTSNLQDGQVLIYDAKNKKLVPADKDFITEKDISSTGEIGKLIRIAANTPLNVDINGSATALDGVNVSVTRPEDGNILVYRKSRNSFQLEPKGATGAGKSLTFTKNNQSVAEYNGSQEINLEIGEAEKLATPRNIKLVGHAEGEVLFDGSEDVELNVTNVTTSLADESEFARKTARLETPRKIKFTGDTSGEITFDGTRDVEVALTVNQAKNVSSAAMALKAVQDSEGNPINTTYATKEELQNSQMLIIDPYLEEYAKTEDIKNLNSASADKLSSERKIKLTGAVKGTVNFDGSKDVEIEVEFAEGTALTAADLAAIFYL